MCRRFALVFCSRSNRTHNNNSTSGVGIVIVVHVIIAWDLGRRKDRRKKGFKNGFFCIFYFEKEGIVCSLFLQTSFVDVPVYGRSLAIVIAIWQVSKAIQIRTGLTLMHAVGGWSDGRSPSNRETISTWQLMSLMAALWNKKEKNHPAIESRK